MTRAMDVPPFLVEFDLRRKQGRLRRVGCVKHLKQLLSVDQLQVQL